MGIVSLQSLRKNTCIEKKFVSSTHNQRIERLWVDVAIHFARSWRVFFLRLERIHKLDRKNPHHLWLLHRLFLAQIQKDADRFCHDWNHHPIRGETTNQQSPEVSKLFAL